LPGVAIPLAMHDVLINLMCINFIWPSTYYAKNLRRVCRKRCHDGSSKHNHSFSSRSISRSREIRMMMSHASGGTSKTKKSLPEMIAERRQQNNQRKRSSSNSVTLVAAEEEELHHQKFTLTPAAIESGGGAGEIKEQQIWMSHDTFQHVPSPPASHSLSKAAPLATCERSGSDATAGGGVILSSSGNLNCGVQQSSNSHLKTTGESHANHQSLDESTRSGIIDV